MYLTAVRIQFQILFFINIGYQLKCNPISYVSFMNVIIESKSPSHLQLLLNVGNNIKDINNDS